MPTELRVNGKVLRVGDEASFAKTITHIDMLAFAQHGAVTADGGEASYSHVISDACIKAFGRASGDRNPVHFDDVFASKTRFKGRIAHGILTAGLIPPVVGMGHGTILTQHVDFERPVRPGQKITAKATTSYVHKGDVLLSTICVNEAGKPVITGRATLCTESDRPQVQRLLTGTKADELLHSNGILAAGLISTVLGTKLPGEGTIYLTQHVDYIRPVRPCEKITAKVRIVLIDGDGVISLWTECANDKGEAVISGYARVMVDTPAA